MAIGFTLLDGVTTVCPDRSLRAESNPRTLIAKFGDGYEQRARDGINSIEEEYSIAFKNRDPSEIDDIIALFNSKGGVENFSFTVLDDNAAGGEKTIKVVCPKYNKVWTNKIAYGCTATFRRVYEP